MEYFYEIKIKVYDSWIKDWIDKKELEYSWRRNRGRYYRRDSKRRGTIGLILWKCQYIIEGIFWYNK